MKGPPKFVSERHSSQVYNIYASMNPEMRCQVASPFGARHMLIVSYHPVAICTASPSPVPEGRRNVLFACLNKATTELGVIPSMRFAAPFTTVSNPSVLQCMLLTIVVGLTADNRSLTSELRPVIVE